MSEHIDLIREAAWGDGHDAAVESCKEAMDIMRSRIAELEARIELADRTACRAMIEAAQDQSTVEAVAVALSKVRVALRQI